MLREVEKLSMWISGGTMNETKGNKLLKGPEVEVGLACNIQQHRDHFCWGKERWKRVRSNMRLDHYSE